jgi:hypothetical protein
MNAIPKNLGFHPSMLRWMLKKAEREGLSEAGHHGGLVFYEMRIQVRLMSGSMMLFYDHNCSNLTLS